LKGPVGVVFLGKDVAAGAKTVLEFAKKNELFVIKTGYIEGKTLGMDGLKAMAALPSREVMLAILLGTLQAPVKGFMTVARGNTQKMVYALNALKDKSLRRHRSLNVFRSDSRAIENRTMENRETQLRSIFRRLVLESML